MVDDRSATPPEDEQDATPDETRRYLSGLSLEETFHIGQSQGRILERLESQGKRLDGLQDAVDGMDKKVSQLIREFGFIKKAWWLGLVALGFVLSEAMEYLPAILS